MNFRETRRWSETRVDIRIPRNAFRLELLVLFIIAFKDGHIVIVLRYGTVHNNKIKINKSMFITEYRILKTKILILLTLLLLLLLR